MNIQTVDHLIKLFTNIDQASGLYVTKHSDGTYAHTSLKANKTLRTEDVAAIAHQAFRIIKEKEGMCYERRAQYCVELKDALKCYSRRVFSSKKWYEKIGAFFGCKTKEEKHFDNAILKTSRKIARYKEKEEKVQKALKTSQKLTANSLNRPYSQLIHFYFGILGSSNLDLTSAKGSNPDEALMWYLNHLKNFHHSMGSLYTPQEIKEVEILIEQLKTAQIFSNAIQREFFAEQVEKQGASYGDHFFGWHKEAWTGLPLVKMHYFRKVIINRLLDMINHLEVDERVLLPGGFHNSSLSGHGVIYIITKEKNKTFSFEIVNSGEGAVAASSFKNDAKTAAKFFMSLKAKTGPVVRQNVKDVRYENLLFTDLSYSFFDEIFSKYVNLQTKDMKEILDYFEQNFKSKKSDKGREHTAQVKDSCSHKSLSATANRLLSDKVYWNFKAWMTGEEIKNMQNMTPQQIDEMHIQPNALPTLIQEAEDMLKKRNKKAADAILT